ncbi:hypothetical protein CAPTEDRAFT_142887 [Capitella teleta]|uniref:GH10 domain-containing protein n=1 Tax=Capitella teleta TaxID=283909 RepID=R7V608_CAPTE|nr:hypothetical protein CAPTEDRAFT_142887 [Capitella teleta]|eukprot:ELU14298.1 hypothetical protein CAPTEDRAFT_142887 [Capitella teleta]
MNSLNQVNQTRQSFPFGANIDSWLHEGGTREEQMRDYFYNLFNCAITGNDMKWPVMETVENEVQFDVVDKSLEALRQHNITDIKGQCLVWGKESKLTEWIQNKTADEIKAAIIRRVKYMTSHYKGQFVQWDVNNENLHHRWFEEKTGNPYITDELFNLTHSLDPTATLFVNDFNLVRNGVYTSAMEQQIRAYQKRGVPVGGIGIQSHLSDLQDADLTWFRLDRLAELGLPLWISELDDKHTNLEQRAEIYEKGLTLYYSHPAVKGIVFCNIDLYLVNEQVQVCESAGKVVRRLLRDEWRTEEVTSFSGPTNHQLKGFHGTYEAIVKDGDQVLKRVVFELVKGEDANIEIQL